MGLASGNGSYFKVLATGGVPTCAAGRGDRDPHVLGLLLAFAALRPPVGRSGGARSPWSQASSVTRPPGGSLPLRSRSATGWLGRRCRRGPTYSSRSCQKATTTWVRSSRRDLGPGPSR